MKKMINKKGFTLVEMVTVVAIITLLAGATFLGVKNYIENAEMVKNNASLVSTAQDEAINQVAKPLVISSITDLNGKPNTNGTGNTQNALRPGANGNNGNNGHTNNGNANGLHNGNANGVGNGNGNGGGNGLTGGNTSTPTPAPTATPVPTQPPVSTGTNYEHVYTSADLSVVTSQSWYCGGRFDVNMVSTTVSYVDLVVPAGLTLTVHGATATDLGNGVYRYEGNLNAWNIQYTFTGNGVTSATIQIVGMGY